MSEQSHQPVEQAAVNALLQAIVNEHRASRRWRIFFRCIWILIAIIGAIYLLSDGTSVPPKSHVAVVNLRGMILDEQYSSAKYISEGLKNAFNNPHSKAVILYINSGGGTPVQSSNIYNTILDLRHQYPDKKLYAVCGDACTSGAYYIAAAANEIYANPVSLVGSIGVVMNGFGFVDILHKLGIERRLVTSGANKALLDPFSPLKQEEVEYTQQLMDIIHQQFIRDVKQGRGKRLHHDPQLFSGLIWTGQQALALGLIDGFGDVNSVAKSIAKEDNIIDYTYYGDLMHRLSHVITNDTALSVSNHFSALLRGLS